MTSIFKTKRTIETTRDRKRINLVIKIDLQLNKIILYKTIKI